MFCVLLLVSAAMATVPGRDDAVTTVRSFYVQHAGVVLTAQLLGLVAAAACALFVLGLGSTEGRGAVVASGLGIVAAAVVTAIPVLVLCLAAEQASAGTLHALALASDLVDVLLFAAIAVFAGVIGARAAMSGLRVLAGLVAVLAAAQAVLLLAGSGLLEVVAPVGFVVLVLTLSVLLLRGRDVVRVPAGSSADRHSRQSGAEREGSGSSGASA